MNPGGFDHLSIMMMMMDLACATDMFPRLDHCHAVHLGPLISQRRYRDLGPFRASLSFLFVAFRLLSSSSFSFQK